MANDLATLRPKLATALRDVGMETWQSAELDDLLTWAAASLYPRVAIPISLPIWPLTEDEEDYDIPGSILEISRVDVAQVSDDTMLFPLAPGTWEITGDVWSGTAKLFVNRSFSNPDWYFVVHGYGAYDLENSLPPDMFVPYILAAAGSEAIKRMLPNRARFENWATRNQKESVSVNELSQMLSQFDAKAERELSRLRTWRKPKPARG
jgi:hypothetical protein